MRRLSIGRRSRMGGVAMVIADASVTAHPPVTHENTRQPPFAPPAPRRARGDAVLPAAFFLIWFFHHIAGDSISSLAIISPMEPEPLADMDVQQGPAPAMHTAVWRLLAEAQQIVQHNHRIIARCRHLAAMDVLSDRPSRHRAAKRTLG